MSGPFAITAAMPRGAGALRGRFILLLLGLLPAVSALAQSADQHVQAENRRCLNCHAQPSIGQLLPEDLAFMVQASAPGDAPADGDATANPNLVVTADSLHRSIHAQLRCVDCHQDAMVLPHARRLEPPNCAGSCHPTQGVEYERSSHGLALVNGYADAPTCSSCHGTHDIARSTDRWSSTYPLNAVKMCAECHEHHATPTLDEDGAQEHVRNYLGSVHGRGISEAGLIVAATCSDCHGNHLNLPATDEAAPTHRDNIPETCGSCHVGVVEAYATSIHGQRLAEGSVTAPVCTDCHTAHEITLASVPGSHVDIIAECGDCHARRELSPGRRATFFDTYRRSYHGQVTALGSDRAAACSDCHGAHEIVPIDDERSLLHGANRVETCGKCHEGANAAFVQYDPHADHLDRARYPLLYAVWWYFIIVMSSAFGFFGLHSILWFIRSVVHHRKNGLPRHNGQPKYAIRRFTVVNRINHALVIFTFFGLTLTGMPLLFSDAAWAKGLASLFGGVYAAGMLHRMCAIMLGANFLLHFISIVRSYRSRRAKNFRGWITGPKSMLPAKRDITDLIAMLRWFVGAGKKPTFERWTYWEKFDYWAEIGGTAIIGGSGLMLWFPGFFSQYLQVPGWMYNVATIIHGYEALLAMGFIFTIHFFNAHLRPEKFPVDDVMFTGHMSIEEFKEERGAEYDRMVADGKLETLYVTPAAPWKRRVAIVVGILAMIIGTSMVVCVVLAGLRAI